MASLTLSSRLKVFPLSLRPSMVAKQPQNLLIIAWMTRKWMVRLASDRLVPGIAAEKDVCTGSQKTPQESRQRRMYARVPRRLQPSAHSRQWDHPGRPPEPRCDQLCVFLLGEVFPFP